MSGYFVYYCFVLALQVVMAMYFGEWNRFTFIFVIATAVNYCVSVSLISGWSDEKLETLKVERRLEAFKNEALLKGVAEYIIDEDEDGNLKRRFELKDTRKSTRG